MKKVTLTIILITLLSKIIGFLRDVVLSYYYGTSNISDAYIISLTIPGVIFTFIAISIKTGFIPLYTEIYNNKGKTSAMNFTNNIINIILLVCTIIVAVALVYMEKIVIIFASGFDDETLVLAVMFSRLSILGIYFTGLVNILSGYLQIKGRYIATVLVGFPLNLFFIIFIILSAHVNLVFLPIGTVIAYFSQLLILLPFLRKAEYKYKPRVNWKDPYLKVMIVMSLPLIVGASLSQINILIDRTIASQVIIGGLSALNYADRLNLVVQGLAVTTISTIFYPILTKLYFEAKMEEYKNIIRKSLLFLTFIMFPSSILFLMFSEEIVTLIFGRGEFDLEAIYLTSTALFYYSIGMLGIGFREVFANAFYTMKNTKTPMINAGIGLVLNIILSIILSKYLGIGGIALATSISSITTAILMYLSLTKIIGSIHTNLNTYSFFKIIFTSIISILTMKIIYEQIQRYIQEEIILIPILILGSLIYITLLYIVRLVEIHEFIDELKKKFK